MVNEIKQVRLAVIGAGQMGVKHAELVRRHDACVLVGICDLDPSRQAVADRLQVPFYRSAETLIERERPSGAIIATPNSRHASVAETCAERSVSTSGSPPSTRRWELSATASNG